MIKPTKEKVRTIYGIMSNPCFEWDCLFVVVVVVVVVIFVVVVLYFVAG